MGEQVLVESDQLTAIRQQTFYGGWVSKMEQVVSFLFSFVLGNNNDASGSVLRWGSNPVAAALKLEQFHSLVVAPIHSAVYMDTS